MLELLARSAGTSLVSARLAPCFGVVRVETGGHRVFGGVGQGRFRGSGRRRLGLSHHLRHHITTKVAQSAFDLIIIDPIYKTYADSDPFLLRLSATSQAGIAMGGVRNDV